MKETVKNTIRVERAIHQITQGELANMSGISRQQIHNIETEKMLPSIKTCLKIVSCLNELKIDTGMDIINIEDIFKLEIT